MNWTIALAWFYVVAFVGTLIVLMIIYSEVGLLVLGLLAFIAILFSPILLVTSIGVLAKHYNNKKKHKKD